MKGTREIAEFLKEKVRKVGKEKAMVWAIECASRVLGYFEEAVPGDPRPRIALEIAKKWLNGGVHLKEIRMASLDAHTAAREAKDGPARLAARTAGQAVATAHAIDHAVGAAMYALKTLEKRDPERVLSEFVWQLKRLEVLGGSRRNL